MRALFLLRHGPTEANERRLYCGRTDLPLSPAGRVLALETAAKRPLPACDLYAASGLRRASETLFLLTGRAPEVEIAELREMDFGAFEMRGYDELKDDADYRRWIADCMGPGVVPCPGGESAAQFIARVAVGGEKLLALEWNAALAVIHGGPVARLMARWFPGDGRGFYDWQPEYCRGWKVVFDGSKPVGYEPI